MPGARARWKCNGSEAGSEQGLARRGSLAEMTRQCVAETFAIALDGHVLSVQRRRLPGRFQGAAMLKSQRAIYCSNPSTALLVLTLALLCKPRKKGCHGMQLGWVLLSP